MIDTDVAVEMVLAGRRRLPAHESLLVAVSGIDGAGKGYVASLTGARLRQGGLNAVTINIDGWLNLPRGASTRSGRQSTFTTTRSVLKRCSGG
jgi:hypothetical protein